MPASKRQQSPEETQLPGMGETQFEPHSSDENSDTNLYNVVRVINEKGSKYLVEWEGVEPTTGNPWPASWVLKKDCTPDLIMEWKALKKARKQEKALKKAASKRLCLISLRARHNVV